MRRWAKTAGGLGLLIAVIALVGPRAALDGVRSVDTGSLAAGAAIAVVTTSAAAWRWRVVARALGLELRWPTAVAEYYRSLFLNSVLPGGIVGDVDRGVRHGRAAEDLGVALRSVVWERTCGQLVLMLATAVVLIAGARRWVPDVSTPILLVIAAVVAGTVIVLGIRRARTLLVRDLRLLRAPAIAVPALLASGVVLAGHVATFTVAARAVGIGTDALHVAGLALPVLAIGGLPLNVAGWGPREGAAAWAFGAAGLGAPAGLAVAVAYGAIALVATLPGAVLLLRRAS